MKKFLAFLCLISAVSINVCAEEKIDDNLLVTMHQYNWENYDIEYRKALLVVLANECAKNLGIKTPELDFFYEEEKVNEDYHNGSFNTAHERVYINETLLWSATESLKTVAHELRHAYQWYHANNPASEIDYQYLYGFNNYTSSFELGYDKQMIEQDARDYAGKVYIDFVNTRDLGSTF